MKLVVERRDGKGHIVSIDNVFWEREGKSEWRGELETATVLCSIWKEERDKLPAFRRGNASPRERGRLCRAGRNRRVDLGGSFDLKWCSLLNRGFCSLFKSAFFSEKLTTI